DQRRSRDLILVLQLDQPHALCSPADGTNILRAYANQFTVRGHHKDVRVVLNAHDRDDLTILLPRLHIDDALTPSALSPVLFDCGSLAESALRHGKHHVVIVACGDHADNVVTLFKPDTNNPICLTAHFANIFILETDAHPIMRTNENGFACKHE